MVDWDKELIVRSYDGRIFTGEVMGVCMRRGRTVRIVRAVDPKGQDDIIFNANEDGADCNGYHLVKNPPQEWWTNVYKQNGKGHGGAMVFTCGLFHSEEEAKKEVSVRDARYCWVKSILLHSE